MAAKCPTNCASWYDGCNTCACVNGRTTICTKRYCKKKGRAYCKKRKCPTCKTMRCRSGYRCVNIRGCGKCIKRIVSKRCPTNCSTWYDGCNTCRCVNGRIMGCTKRYCKRYTRPYCKKKKCPTCKTIRCRSGYRCVNVRGCGKCVKRIVSKRCPRKCVSWYDGCNTCRCVNGRVTACTKRACVRYGKPMCRKYKK
jgi:hypothetical protein